MNKLHMNQDLLDAAQRAANVYARIANTKMGCDIPVPVPLRFDLCDVEPKTAGRANSLMFVTLNYVLYENNVAYFLNDTIPHEIGHLVQFQKFDLKGAKTPGHGAEWHAIMTKFGKTPHKLHDLDVTPAVEYHKELKKAAKAAKAAKAKKRKGEDDDE